MPKMEKIGLGNIKVGHEGAYFVAHLFLDETFITELAKIHHMLVRTPEDYKQFKEFVLHRYEALIREQIPTEDGESITTEEISLRESGGDLN